MDTAVEREQAQVQSIDATAERLHLLDRATVESGTAAFSETVAADGHVLYEQVQERLRQRDRPQSEFQNTLVEVPAGARVGQRKSPRFPRSPPAKPSARSAGAGTADGTGQT